MPRELGAGPPCYDAPGTPLERVLACREIAREVAAQLQRQRDQLDPFALAAAIDQKLERIFALANPHHLGGWPEVMLLRGKIVVDRGKLRGQSGDGKSVARKLAAAMQNRPAV